MSTIIHLPAKDTTSDAEEQQSTTNQGNMALPPLSEPLVFGWQATYTTVPFHSHAVVIPPARDPPIQVNDVRRNRSKKNLIVQESGVEHNIKQLIQRIPTHGRPYEIAAPDPYDPLVYDFQARLSNMGSEDKKKFFAANFAEVVVDIESLNAVSNEKKGIIAVIGDLGPEFAACLPKLTIYLDFPLQAASSDTLADRLAMPDAKKTPAFNYLKNLVNKINEFQKIDSLDIIVRTPATEATPVTNTQLIHFLPFYELKFRKWNMKWQQSYMPRPEHLNGPPYSFVEGERRKTMQEQKAAVAQQRQDARATRGPAQFYISRKSAIKEV
ncbi:hypothetical protein B0J14DRAFT_569771 [Halenospora varia]|nr:hypothetical protein B0J14DRAFT_569771 [Halenospora varia]